MQCDSDPPFKQGLLSFSSLRAKNILNCCVQIILGKALSVWSFYGYVYRTIYRQIKYHDALVHRWIVPPLMPTQLKSFYIYSLSETHRG